MYVYTYCLLYVTQIGNSYASIEKVIHQDIIFLSCKLHFNIF